MSASPLSTRPPVPASLLVAACLAGAAEWLVLTAGWRRESLAAVATGHLVVSALLAAWLARPAQRQGQYSLLLFVSTLAFGPLGPTGVLLAAALERYHRRHATDIEEWHRTLFPPSRVDEQADLWRRIGQRASDLPNGQPVTPFLDVLGFGSVQQRQAVIAIIVQHFHPAFAPALKAALRDEHNVIRVQAATAIARLENEFLEKTMQLESECRMAPGDAARVLALATHYDDQAFAGLLDTTREQDCRVRAAEGYGRYLALHPDNAQARFRLGRLQLRRGLWREAETLFRQLMDAGDPEAAHWLMESLFAQRRYADLRQVAARRTALGSTSADTHAPEVAETMALWTGPEVAA